MDNLRNQTKIKKIVLISILVSLSVILSIFDGYISRIAFPFVPLAKIGLANIVILVGVYHFDYKETLVMVVLKSLLANLIIGGPISFFISIVASLVSYLGMILARSLLKERVSAISVSVIGGFLHIVSQLAVVSLIYRIGEPVIYYGSILIALSLVTSIIVGFIGIKLDAFIKQIENS
jgi:heptaprenyl diphosphate synthase